MRTAALVPFGVNLPAQHTQNQVENEEGSKDDQADEVDPGQLEAHGIIHLHQNTSSEEEGGLKDLDDSLERFFLYCLLLFNIIYSSFCHFFYTLFYNILSVMAGVVTTKW